MRRPRIEMKRYSPQRDPTIGLFILQEDGSLRCATCQKERIDCLVWNPSIGVHDYRIRTLNPGEKLLITSLSEVGPVRIVAEPVIVHGVLDYLLAEKIVCAAGFMPITGTTSATVRAYGSRAPGRIVSCRRRGWRRSRSHRRPPTPLKFHVPSVYSSVLRNILPIPRSSEELVRLLGIFARRLRTGDEFEALLRAYADEFAAYLDLDEIEPEDAREGESEEEDPENQGDEEEHR